MKVDGKKKVPGSVFKERCSIIRTGEHALRSEEENIYEPAWLHSGHSDLFGSDRRRCSQAQHHRTWEGIML